MPYSKQPVLLETNLPGVKLFSRGKVRDVYELGDKLLVVATDRLSAFDVVMREGIPDKGRVLNQLSRFWFDLIKDEIPHHFITAKITDYPPELQPFSDQLEGRSMLVQKARPFPIECVVRGYWWVRLERISRQRKCVRNQAACRLAGSFATGESYLYAFHQSTDRP